MTVYNINLGIGWASSGVEYAQAYRSKVFKNLGIDAKFIFTDFFSQDNIIDMTRNVGFADDQIIWLYTYFTDQKPAATIFTEQDLKAQFTRDIIKEDREARLVRFYFGDRDFATAYYCRNSKTLIHRVEFVSNGNLVRKDFYSSDVRSFTEYYAPKDNAAKLYKRSFYNVDGSVAYDEITDGDQPFYRFPNYILNSKEELVEHFMKELQLSADDLVILDRSTGIGQSVFRHVKPAKLAVAVHAEHFSENGTNDHNVLWNNYYDFQFTNADSVDAFIVATDRQREILAEQFLKYKDIQPNIVTIPVGSIDELKEPKSPRIPFSVMTASRLASEKHVDWLIKAVVDAQRFIPDINFDIYGSGGEEERLRQIIEENKAQDYIQLRGHHDLSHIYMQHEVYLSASKSEGFGLTLLEAIGSGLPLIGFDVRYGNQNFIKDGENGYLIPISELDSDAEIIDNLSMKIVEIFTQASLDQMHRASYDMARDYLTDKVEDKWNQLIKEMTND
ncbi:accessory Sec system glycosyltransferase GtfA [Streptococcus dentapri]|uniref:UDP-N-acetylglucosamine--peptide N-acetylglucosaminyltransferase GtfA subunit n=1 Tax=Streptococcus dentapri TaxID=573564 RepID=A0ABV8D087_9STRE